MSAADPAPPPAAPRLVPDDLSCLACGYALRGLDADGGCPECGASIARSRDAAEHWGLPPEALRDTARGLRTGGWSAGLSGAAMALPPLFLLTGVGFQPSGEVLFIGWLSLQAIVSGAEHVTWLRGVGLLTKHARLRGSPSRRAAAGVAHAAAWLTLVSCVGLAALLVASAASAGAGSPLLLLAAALGMPFSRCVALFALARLLASWKRSAVGLRFALKAAAICCAVFTGAWPIVLSAGEAAGGLLVVVVLSWFFLWLFAIVAAAEAGRLARAMMEIDRSDRGVGPGLFMPKDAASRLRVKVRHATLRRAVAEVTAALPPAVRRDLAEDAGFFVADVEVVPGEPVSVPVAGPGHGRPGRCVVLKRSLAGRPEAFIRWVIAHELAHAYLRNEGRTPREDPESAADALAAAWGFARPRRAGGDGGGASLWSLPVVRPPEHAAGDEAGNDG